MTMVSLCITYVNLRSFSFGSGDQEPGGTTGMVLSLPGELMVLRGIHPKMRHVTVKRT
jgi:hypothetical protein